MLRKLVPHNSLHTGEGSWECGMLLLIILVCFRNSEQLVRRWIHIHVHKACMPGKRGGEVDGRGHWLPQQHAGGRAPAASARAQVVRLNLHCYGEARDPCAHVHSRGQEFDDPSTLSTPVKAIKRPIARMLLISTVSVPPSARRRRCLLIFLSTYARQPANPLHIVGAASSQ